MHRSSIQNRDGLNCVVSFIGRKEPRLSEMWDRPPNRTSDVIDIEKRRRKLRLKCVGDKVGLGDLVVQIPSGQGGILIVVKYGAMITGPATLGGHAHVSNAGVFGAEVA